MACETVEEVQDLLALLPTYNQTVVLFLKEIIADFLAPENVDITLYERLLTSA